MEWVAILILGTWLLFIDLKSNGLKKDVERLERVQGGQLYRELNRYPPRHRR